MQIVAYPISLQMQLIIRHYTMQFSTFRRVRGDGSDRVVLFLICPSRVLDMGESSWDVGMMAVQI